MIAKDMGRTWRESAGTPLLCPQQQTLTTGMGRKLNEKAEEAIMRMDGGERGSFRQRGYDARWDKAAAAFKAEHPLCLGCQAIGQVKVATVVDHVEPHKGDMIKFWNAAMFQPSCAWHHNVVKQQLEAMYERGAVTPSDLWLNSLVAIKLSRKCQAKAIGVDGWPVA